MADLFASGRIVDLILCLVVLECMALWLYRRRTGRGPGLTALLPTIAAGAGLLLAWRAALAGLDWPWIGALLFAALLAHLADLALRWRQIDRLQRDRDDNR